MTSWTYLDPVFEFNISAGVDGYALEGLAGLIVGLAAALQCSTRPGVSVEIALAGWSGHRERFKRAIRT